MEEKVVLNIATTQLKVLRVIRTVYTPYGLPLYLLISKHNNDKTNYRFGTMAQIVSMLKCYRHSVLLGYQKEYNDFLNRE